jgi:hypothetical protein
MKVKEVHKTVLEVSVQEIIDELISNFNDLITGRTHDLTSLLEHSRYLTQSLEQIYQNDYKKLFEGGGALKCLPEDVFDMVEEYFYGDDDGDEEDEEDKNVINFKKASKEIKQTELEIAIKRGDEIVARIFEEDIQY